MNEADVLSLPEFKQAVSLVYSEDYLQASQVLTELLNVYPQSSSLLYNLAICNTQLGAYDMAAELFANVLEIEPDFTTAIINFGKMECQRGNAEQGLALFERAYKIEPDNLDARLARAMAYHSCGHISDALQEFDVLLTEEKCREFVLYFHISCLVQLQYFTRALNQIAKLEAKGEISSELIEIKELCQQHLEHDQDSIGQHSTSDKQDRVIFQHAL